MSGKRGKAASPPAEQQRFHNPFASLEGIRSQLPQGESRPVEEERPSESAERGPARAVVRLERKGRGGKEVTVVEKLGLGPTELERWCKALKQSLGCGGAVVDEAIELQGDQRERLRVTLAERGVRKVSVG